MSLGENLKSIRTKLHISIEQFAKKTGIPVDECAQIEANSRSLTSAEIQTICSCLHISFDDLIKEHQDPVIDATDEENSRTNGRDESIVIPAEQLKMLLGKMKD